MSIIKKTFGLGVQASITAGAIWAAFFGGPVGVINLVAAWAWFCLAIGALCLVGAYASPKVTAQAALLPRYSAVTWLHRLLDTAAIVSLFWVGAIASGIAYLIGVAAFALFAALAESLRKEFSPSQLKTVAEGAA